MHDYNTIVGVIEMRDKNIPLTSIRQRYGIGYSGIDLILTRYKDSGLTLTEFLALAPSQAEELIYPPKNIRNGDIPMPDFELYYERMVSKGSRVNMFYCWLDYNSQHPDGYQRSQFYEYFNRFITAVTKLPWPWNAFPVRRCTSTGLATNQKSLLIPGREKSKRCMSLQPRLV